MTLEVGDQELLVGAPAPGWYRQARARGWLSPSSRSAAAGSTPTGTGPGPGRDGRGRARRAGWSPPRPYRRQVPARMVRSVPARRRSGACNPATSYDVLLSGSGWPRRRVATFTTLGPPPGRLLSRFATIGDCHIGEPIRRRPPAVPRPRTPGHLDLAPYAVRCARAAIAEAEAWGAELLVAKGRSHLRRRRSTSSRTRSRVLRRLPRCRSRRSSATTTSAVTAEAAQILSAPAACP